MKRYTTTLHCTGCQERITITGNYRGSGTGSCVRCDMVFKYRLIYPEYYQSQEF